MCDDGVDASDMFWFWLPLFEWQTEYEDLWINGYHQYTLSLITLMMRVILKTKQKNDITILHKPLLVGGYKPYEKYAWQSINHPKVIEEKTHMFKPLTSTVNRLVWIRFVPRTISKQTATEYPTMIPATPPMLPQPYYHLYPLKISGQLGSDCCQAA